MKTTETSKLIGLACLMMFFFLFSGCASTQSGELADQQNPATYRRKDPAAPATPTPTVQPLQREILSKKNSSSITKIGTFDFKNFTYPMPRGWQDNDAKEIVLRNGSRHMTEEKIGMSYVTTKYGDVTGNGKDDAMVILKVETGGSAIPQLVYIFDWRNNAPNLLWYFRTGDRADGGLKRVYAENGKLVVELYGRDRYIFTKMETSKIVGDEQNLCCPTHFTRSRYKKSGDRFVLDGDRLTYSIDNNDAAPVKNMNEKKLKEARGSKK